MTVHPHANAFEESAAEYERGRPGYPRSILAWLAERDAIGVGRVVVDLGAGTGKLTRVLVDSGSRVIAVEPLPAMRDELARILPDVELLDGTAEAIPLPDASADMVTCGQSFRWFANDRALTEIARVLRPGGELVLAFNGYDENDPLQQRLVEIQRAAETETVEDKPGSDWRQVLSSCTLFAPIDDTVLANELTVDRDGLASRVRSSSQFFRLPDARQAELLASLATLVDGDTVALALHTEVLALRRL